MLDDNWGREEVGGETIGGMREELMRGKNSVALTKGCHLWKFYTQCPFSGFGPVLRTHPVCSIQSEIARTMATANVLIWINTAP